MSMHRILVINPNSSRQMTDDIVRTLERSHGPDFSCTVERTEAAPTVLESFADYTLAGAAVLFRLAARPVSGKYDGVLLACMGDPCLYAVKEACPVPAVGIAEAAVSLALLTGYKFSIIAASEKAKPMMESMVAGYGLTQRMASVETLRLPIEDFLCDPGKLRESIRTSAERAWNNGADVLILGCAGMTMIHDELPALCGMPIIDPVTAGEHMLEAVVRGGFEVSRRGLYAPGPG